MSGAIYRFDDCELHTSRFQLMRSGHPVHVEPRALDVLRHLIEHRDRVVSKDELLDLVWGGPYVSEAALATALRTARMAVGHAATSGSSFWCTDRDVGGRFPCRNVRPLVLVHGL